MLFVGGVIHLIIGVIGVACPRWFFNTVPPWPPLHVGQIQIGGIFDLMLAALFLGSATDVRRYLPLTVGTGVVAEWGHATVRIGHIIGGSNPPADLVLPILMLLYGSLLAAFGVRFAFPRPHSQ
jgi:hypothetical protein